MYTCKAQVTLPWNGDKGIKTFPITAQFQVMGDTTVCLMFWERIFLGSGVALLNPTDKFDFTEGCKIAAKNTIQMASMALFMYAYKTRGTKLRKSVLEQTGHILASIRHQIYGAIRKSILNHATVQDAKTDDAQI